MPTLRTGAIVLLSWLVAVAVTVPVVAGPTATPHPVLFVTQMPIAQDFATIGSTFANHFGRIDKVGRGGDLYIRYPDGTLRNLTREAGYGEPGVFQGENAIAVRDPMVHWSGTKALFSMVVGAPAQQYQVVETRWQLYEITGLAQGETAVVTLVPHQPQGYNNVTPVYAPDGAVLFTSDRPRNGAAHLYPQHDEYESTATNTGLWRLDPTTGALVITSHAPSGVFTPSVDSFGRVIFSRWDHLQRDQQADAGAPLGNTYGTFNFSDESADAQRLDTREEVFPEPRAVRTDLLSGTNLEGHSLNHFLPWQIHPDGTGEETLNHIGRHELVSYFNRVFDDDPNLVEFIESVSGRFNPNPIENLFQIDEDPTTAGAYIGVNAPEFGTHASGQIVRLDAPPSQRADQIAVVYLTHPETATIVGDGDPVPPGHSGHYRDPLPLANGTLIAAHSDEVRYAGNDGTRPLPDPRYDFLLKQLNAGTDGYLRAGAPLTGGIVRELTYWDPDVLVRWNGPMWELSPVEVRPRPVPPLLGSALPAPEAQVFADLGIDPAVFQADLERRGTALVVSRDVTTRDAADRQQPFNLSVEGGGASTVGASGQVYGVSHLQFFQADQIRGIGGLASPRPGRRVLAQVMHDEAVHNPPHGGPPGSVTIAADGSMAAMVPARRAMSWQLLDSSATPVVRERFWVTFQPGEVRVCASCHGLNSIDQAGQGEPDQPPQALRDFLLHWQSTLPLFADGFEAGDSGAWSAVAGN